ncbi:MAG: C39 family peptidase [Spirochaetales bacterium]|nr:C39 family peptidase [Spirochaetales bacterium]
MFAFIVIINSFFIVQTIQAEEIKHSKYFVTEQITLSSGNILEKSVISGPPTPPVGFERTTMATLPEPNKAVGINIISDVPAFTWCFGCSPTAAAMIAGYYDRNGYSDMYTGPTNNGKMPLNNDTYWTTWTDSGGDLRCRNPLSATQNGLDGRTERGHVDDYWIELGNNSPDPFVKNGWTEHTPGECTADFMGTNQVSPPMKNKDGATTFWHYSNGKKITAKMLYNLGQTYYKDSGLFGIIKFFKSRGYDVIEAYNQYIHPYGNNTHGFTYEQYKAEIDAGRPVLFNLTGHTMVGTGYNDSSGNIMYIHDTWDHSTHTMTWGGSYSGMTQFAVTIVILEESNEQNRIARPWIDLLLLQ